MQKCASFLICFTLAVAATSSPTAKDLHVPTALSSNSTLKSSTLMKTKIQLVEINVAGAWRYLIVGDDIASLGLYENKSRSAYLATYED